MAGQLVNQIETVKTHKREARRFVRKARNCGRGLRS